MTSFSLAEHHLSPASCGRGSLIKRKLCIRVREKQSFRARLDRRDYGLPFEGHLPNRFPVQLSNVEEGIGCGDLAPVEHDILKGLSQVRSLKGRRPDGKRCFIGDLIVAGLDDQRGSGLVKSRLFKDVVHPAEGEMHPARNAMKQELRRLIFVQLRLAVGSMRSCALQGRLIPPLVICHFAGMSSFLSKLLLGQSLLPSCDQDGNDDRSKAPKPGHPLSEAANLPLRARGKVHENASCYRGERDQGGDPNIQYLQQNRPIAEKQRLIATASTD